MPNIFDFDRLYRRTKRGAGDSSAVVTIKLDPIASRTLRVLTHVTVENRSGTCSRIRLAVDHRGFIHYLDEIMAVIAKELVVSRSDILLAEGDAFLTELTDTTNDNVLVLTCIGWEKDI